MTSERNAFRAFSLFFFSPILVPVLAHRTHGRMRHQVLYP